MEPSTSQGPSLATQLKAAEKRVARREAELAEMRKYLQIQPQIYQEAAALRKEVGQLRIQNATLLAERDHLSQVLHRKSAEELRRKEEAEFLLASGRIRSFLSEPGEANPSLPPPQAQKRKNKPSSGAKTRQQRRVQSRQKKRAAEKAAAENATATKVPVAGPSQIAMETEDQVVGLALVPAERDPRMDDLFAWAE